MGDAIYAIDQFPDDDLLWRIEWIGGVRCFQAYVIDDYVTPRVPSNHAARKEFERSSHRMIAIN
jgi:hypothetical protein